MMGADPGYLREPPKIGARVYVRRDFDAHAADKIGLSVALRPVWMAPPAGTESGVFRGLGHGEQDHLPGMRASRWAGRPAINSGGPNRVYECTVKPSIPRLNRPEVIAPATQCKIRSPWCEILHRL